MGTQTITDLIEIFHMTNIPLIPDFQHRQSINIQVKCFAKFTLRMYLFFFLFFLTNWDMTLIDILNIINQLVK